MLFPAASSSLDSSSFTIVASTLLWDTTLFVGLLREVHGETSSFFSTKMDAIFLSLNEFTFSSLPPCKYALFSVPFEAKLKNQNMIRCHNP